VCQERYRTNGEPGGVAPLRAGRPCYAARVSELSPDVQSRLRLLAARSRAPLRRPRFFLLLYGVLVLVIAGALLARVGTPGARAVAAALVLAPFFIALGLTLWERRGKADLVSAATRAVASVDVELSARMRRAVRLVRRLTERPLGESVALSELYLDEVLARVPTVDVEQKARQRGRRLTWIGLCLLLLVCALTWGRTLSVVEGLDVLLARRGVAPFTIPYVEEAEIEAELPPHLGGSRKIPILYDQMALPAGSEVSWRIVPRALDRKFVLTDGVRDVPFVSDGHGAWIARLRVDESSDLRVAALFGAVKVHDRERLLVSTIVDRAPTVTLVGGRKELRIAELDRLPIDFVAQDDYGLSVVELVVESGERKERQELARLDGNRRTYRGATALTRKTPLIKGAYQPVIVTIQVRDADLVTGPHWGKSEPIVLLPEPLGEALAERHRALRDFRRALVDYLVKSDLASRGPAADVEPAMAAATETLRGAFTQLESRLARTAAPPRGSLQFLRAQLARLQASAAPRARIASTLLATDMLLSELARADAERVSQELGDVVDEVAARVHAALGSEATPRPDQLLASHEAARQGALRLSEIGTAGLDLGSVALADLSRARRLLEAGELSRAEAALMHLAARLRRATPSFGSKGASVEAGSSGSSGGSQPPLSRAPSDYDRLSSEVRALAEQHAREQSELEKMLEEAARAAEADASKDEDLQRVADELREALGVLPSFGRVPGSATAEAAQARSQGEGMADALEAGQLERALQAGQATAEGLERARRAMETMGSYLSEENLKHARAAVERARAAAEAARNRRPKASLAERAARQRELGNAASDLAERAREGTAPLGEDAGEALRRAGELMKKAAEALERGDAERGKELAAEAQEELERASPEQRRADTDGEAAESDSGDSDTPHSGHTEVPGQGEDRSRDFRQRVEAGLGRESGRFGPAVRRYAETLK